MMNMILRASGNRATREVDAHVTKFWDLKGNCTH